MLAIVGVVKAETTNGTAGANIVIDLSISENTALSFGSIILGTQESVVAFGSGAVTTALGVVSGDATLNGSSILGTFILTGEPNQALATITVSSSGTLNNGPNVLNATYSTRGIIPTELNQSGKETFAVGGTLTIPAGAVAGAYTGTYEITYSY